jgi:hypothetical protein
VSRGSKIQRGAGQSRGSIGSRLKTGTELSDLVSNRIERFFNKLKNARCVATRYDKTADSFMASIQLASIKIWRRFINRT